MRNFILLPALLSLLAVNSHAQIQKSVPLKSAASTKPTQVKTLDWAAYLAQAKSDKEAVKAKLLVDQSSTDSGAVCRVSYDRAQLQYISWFENNAAEIKSRIEEHKKLLLAPQEELMKVMPVLNSFEVSVLPTQVQTMDTKSGILNVRFSADKSSVLISLAEAVAFLDLFNARMKSCEKDEVKRSEKIAEVVAAFNDPYSNRWGLTYDQIVVALQKLSEALNSKLKENGVVYRLSYLDPGSNACSAVVELIQEVGFSEDENKKTYRHSLSYNESLKTFTLNGSSTINKNTSVSDGAAFRDLNDQGARLGGLEKTYSFDGYARWISYLNEITENCIEELGLSKAKFGLVDEPYISPASVLSLQARLRNPLSSITSRNTLFAGAQSFYLNKNGRLSGWGISNDVALALMSQFPQKKVSAISSKNGHQMGAVLFEDGEMWHWQNGSEVRLTPFPAKTRIKTMVTGPTHALAVSQDGKLWSWGENHYGETGSTDRNANNVPMLVGSMKEFRVKSVAAGTYRSFALLEDGRLFSAGYNGYGAAAGGGAAFSEITAFGKRKVSQVFAGSSHTFVILEGGAVFGFGYNYYGQVGIGTLGDKAVSPTEISFFKGMRIVSIAVGGYHTLALTADGRVYAWGANAHGQLGLGDTQDRSVPVEITSLRGEVEEIAASNHGSSVLMKNGTRMTWGYNNSRELSVESNATDVVVPTQVTAP